MARSDQDGLWTTDLDISYDDDGYSPHCVEGVEEEVLTDWTVPAIVSAAVCFPPTGIIAFFQARKAKQAASLGDTTLTARYLERTRILVFVTCILGLVMYGVIITMVQSIRHVHTSR